MGVRLLDDSVDPHRALAELEVSDDSVSPAALAAGIGKMPRAIDVEVSAAVWATLRAALRRGDDPVLDALPTLIAKKAKG
jgi:hypothetical protein